MKFLNIFFKIIITNFLLVIYISKSYATIHEVHIGYTYHVDCFVGDTLAFYGGQNLDHIVYINGQIVLHLVSLSNGYIGQYFIVGGETSFMMWNAEGGFSGTITVLDVNIINDSDKNKEILIFPNPVSDKLSLKNLQTKILQINIYEQTGLLVKTLFCKNNEITINLSDVQQGVYFIEIISNNRKSIDKFIKL